MADETQNSTDGTVAQAVARIAELDSADAVLAYVQGDDRQGVRQAADGRLSALAGSGEIATADPRAVPGQPLQAGGSGAKRVRTRFPVDRFEHGIDGLPAITAAGVEVPAGKVEQLLELALEHQTPLEEVEA
jgi:hypothetical protein